MNSVGNEREGKYILFGKKRYIPYMRKKCLKMFSCACDEPSVTN
jgi:hypothetical protein